MTRPCCFKTFYCKMKLDVLRKALIPVCWDQLWCTKNNHHWQEQFKFKTRGNPFTFCATVQKLKSGFQRINVLICYQTTEELWWFYANNRTQALKSLLLVSLNCSMKSVFKTIILDSPFPPRTRNLQALNLYIFSLHSAWSGQPLLEFYETTWKLNSAALTV